MDWSNHDFKSLKHIIIAMEKCKRAWLSISSSVVMASNPPSDAGSSDTARNRRGWDTPTDGRSGHSVHSLLSHAMEELETMEIKAVADNGEDYSSEEEDLAQAQEDGKGRSQAWAFLCKDLLDIVLEYMSHDAEMKLSEIGLNGNDRDGQAMKFNYLTVEALASHKESQMKHGSARSNLQTFISGLSPTVQLDRKGSLMGDLAHSPNGSGEGRDGGISRPPSTSSQSSLPPRPPSSSSTSSVVPHVLPLVGTRDEYQLWAAEEDGSVMDDLPAFNMTSNVMSMGLNDFVVVKRQGDTVMMHVRIEEREGGDNRNRGGAGGECISKLDMQRSASHNAVSDAIAITPSKQSILDGDVRDVGSQQQGQGQGRDGTADDSNSSYNFFAPVMGRSRTEGDHFSPNNSNSNSGAASTTSASRTFASYLGLSSTSAAKEGGDGERHTSNVDNSDDDGGLFADVVAEPQPVDGEQKEEEQESLPPEFDEDTRSRYLERRDRDRDNVSRRSMSMTEGLGWVASKEEDIYSHIRRGGNGSVAVKVRKPNVDLEWKCIKELVISVKGAEAEDQETLKASYKALMRDNESSGLSTRGDGIATNHGDLAASTSGKTGLESDRWDMHDEQSLASLHSHDEGIYTLNDPINDGGDISLASASDDGDVFGMSMEE